MAYLRSENENLEIDYPLEKIWATIPTVIKILEWKLEEKDDASHKVKIQTKGGFMSYSSKFTVTVTPLNEKSCRMAIDAETPVTTITSVIDFGRTKDRIGQFVEILSKEMEKQKTA